MQINFYLPVFVVVIVAVALISALWFAVGGMAGGWLLEKVTRRKGYALNETSLFFFWVVLGGPVALLGTIFYHKTVIRAQKRGRERHQARLKLKANSAEPAL